VGSASPSHEPTRRRILTARVLRGVAELLIVTVIAGFIQHEAWPAMVHGFKDATVAVGLSAPLPAASSAVGALEGDVIKGPGGQCVDVAGNDTGSNGAFVDLWNCQASAIDQHWTPDPDGALTTLGRCLDIDGNGTAPGTKVELWDCDDLGGQVWERQPGGSFFNPQSGLCLDAPGDDAANGTQLQIWPCTGGAAETFSPGGNLTLTGTIQGPGAQCIGIAGDGPAVLGAHVGLQNCEAKALSENWYHSASGSLETVGLCLDIDADSTVPGAKVELWGCDGAGGQVWEQQPGGFLLNPQSGLCLDAPGSAEGTQLQIGACNGGRAERFPLS
jgi:non-reducing end alpha-L-arabinofuranosidase